MQIPKSQLAKAELKFSYTPPQNPVKIRSDLQSVAFMREIWDDDLMAVQEQFYAIFLNNQHEVISWRCVHTGGADCCLIDAKILFALACGCLASSMVIAHNHPSGSFKPSFEDREMTAIVAKIAQIFQIKLLDSLIINKVGSYSILHSIKID